MNIWNKTLKDMYESCYFTAHVVSEVSDEEGEKKCNECEFKHVCLITPDQWTKLNKGFEDSAESEDSPCDSECCDSNYEMNSQTIIVEKGGVVNVYNNYK